MSQEACNQLENALLGARQLAHFTMQFDDIFTVVFTPVQVIDGQQFIKVTPLGDSPEDRNEHFVLVCKLLRDLEEPFAAVKGRELWWFELIR